MPHGEPAQPLGESSVIFMFIKINGSNFPGIAPVPVDYPFSFGAYVPLDFPIIEE